MAAIRSGQSADDGQKETKGSQKEECVQKLALSYFLMFFYDARLISSLVLGRMSVYQRSGAFKIPCFWMETSYGSHTRSVHRHRQKKFRSTD